MRDGGESQRRSLALLAIAALLAGCPSKPKYPECKIDQDCAEHGQVCLNGFCKECREDANCAAKPDKPVCKDAICTAKPQCAKTEDCPAGQKCTAEGRCVPECSVETAAQDCGQGKKCIAGRCATEEACLADADCGEGRACVDKLCKAQGGLLQSSSSQKLGGCEVRAIYFGFDEAVISGEGRKQLEADFQCLQQSAFRRAIVSGHTDERGTTEYNLALGERRADAVKKYLVGLGADAHRMKAISYGKERPADPGHDEAAWARNRRVEIVTEQ
jgi:peptidoglycan-associated lipoprotein